MYHRGARGPRNPKSCVMYFSKGALDKKLSRGVKIQRNFSPDYLCINSFLKFLHIQYLQYLRTI